MKWIKASERLPDFKDLTELYFARYKRSKEKVLYDYIELKERHDNGYVLEWLDESQLSEKESRIKELEEALRELVELKNIKEIIELGVYASDVLLLQIDYEKRKEAAWQAARKSIAQSALK